MFGSIIGAIGGIIGANKAAKASKNNAKRQWKQQKQAMQQGVQWRVNDAKAAGIHPLYALGANTGGGSWATPQTPDYGSAYSAAGNAVGKGMEALAKAQGIAGLQKTKAETELVKAQSRTLMAKAATEAQSLTTGPNAHVKNTEGERVSINWGGSKVAGDKQTTTAERAEQIGGDVLQLLVGARHTGYMGADYLKQQALKYGIPYSMLLRTIQDEERSRNRSVSKRTRSQWNNERSAYLRRRYGYHGGSR